MEMASLEESALGSPEKSWREILFLGFSLHCFLLASLLSAKLLLQRSLSPSRQKPEENQNAAATSTAAAAYQRQSSSPDVNLPDPINMDVEEEEIPTISNLSRYQFLPQRDSEVFLQPIRATTVSMKGSFFESDSDVDSYSVAGRNLDYRSGAFSDSSSDEDDEASTSPCPNFEEELTFSGENCKFGRNSGEEEDDAASTIPCPSFDEKSVCCAENCKLGRNFEEEDAVSTILCPNLISSPGNHELGRNSGEDEETAIGRPNLVPSVEEEGEEPIFAVENRKLGRNWEQEGEMMGIACPNLIPSLQDEEDLSFEEEKSIFLRENLELGQSWEGEEEDDELWESDDMIEELKMEMRKARLEGALPTIAEDSLDLNLKVPKLNYAPLREDPIAALRKLHKGYRERMKKLDVLNYQKISAMSLLQLKNIGEDGGGKFWRRRRRCGDGMSERMMREIEVDLETVYVGQLCLSWEFLHWQYQRVRAEVDDGGRGGSYDVAAGEFQQFQVLLERFLEDEAFEGPRVENYTRSRRRLRGLLLQVPLFREDAGKKKKKKREEKEGSISIEELEYIIEDSIRIFWEFVRAEKSSNNTPAIFKSIVSSPLPLHDPADHDLALKVQSLLKKKQKSLKEEIRAGTCIVRRLRKSRERKPNEDDLFFSQVDVKLVERVLSMASVTGEHLSWCLRKMKSIHSDHRKLSREPSFLLFPC